MQLRHISTHGLDGVEAGPVVDVNEYSLYQERH
jgi:hypothetical protein